MGPLLSCMVLYDPIWSRMVPYIPVSSCMSCMVPFVPVWSRMVPCPLWSYMVLYGLFCSVWFIIFLYDPVWPCTVPYGPVWSLMVLYGPVYNPFLKTGYISIIPAQMMPIFEHLVTETLLMICLPPPSQKIKKKLFRSKENQNSQEIKTIKNNKKSQKN